jgi:hypothetical protein
LWWFWSFWWGEEEGPKWEGRRIKEDPVSTVVWMNSLLVYKLSWFECIYLIIINLVVGGGKWIAS